MEIHLLLNEILDQNTKKISHSAPSAEKGNVKHSHIENLRAAIGALYALYESKNEILFSVWTKK